MSWLALAVAVVLGMVSLLTGHPPQGGLTLGLLAGMALLLELTAPRIGGFGFASGGPAVCMALALLPGQGSAPAACLNLGVVLLRTVVRSQGRTPDQLAAEAALDLVPAQATIAVLSFFRGPVGAMVGVIVYLLGVALMPRWLAPAHRPDVRALLVGLAFAGPGLAVLAEGNPLQALWLLPVMLGLQRASELIRASRRAEAEEQRLQTERQSLQQLADTHRRLSTTSRALADQTEARLTLEEALEERARAHARLKVWAERLDYLLQGGRALALALSPEEIAASLERLLSDTLAPERGVLFNERGEVKRAWGAWTPEQQQLARAAAEQVVDKPLLESILMACPLLTEFGSVGSVVVFGEYAREQRDIFHMISFQAAVVLHNARLYQDVLEAKRQLELSQAQLIQSSKLAAVGQLAAGVAHEINTPLASVLLEIESAELRLESKPQLVPAKLQRARESTLACKGIIAKLLFYSREGTVMSAGIDLNQVVQDALEMFGHQLTLDGVQLSTELAPALPGVQGNANELQQVVVNLLLNARDAVRGGERRQVRLGTRADNGSVLLVVQDTGCGMAPDVLARAFDPFFTTKEVGRGTGLGLSVSQQIAEQHGGRLEAESAPGRGTLVRLRLPAQ